MIRSAYRVDVVCITAVPCAHIETDCLDDLKWIYFYNGLFFLTDVSKCSNIFSVIQGEVWGHTYHTSWHENKFILDLDIFGRICFVYKTNSRHLILVMMLISLALHLFQHAEDFLSFVRWHTLNMNFCLSAPWSRRRPVLHWKSLLQTNTVLTK